MDSVDFSDYFVNSFINYALYLVSRVRVLISVVCDVLLYAPMFMTFSVHLFSLYFLAYLYSLSRENVLGVYFVICVNVYACPLSKY
jgi:hypothetical protein